MVSSELLKAEKIMIEEQLGMKKGDELMIATSRENIELAYSGQNYCERIGVKSYITLAPPRGRGETYTPMKALQSLANEVDGIYSLGMGGFSTKEALEHGTRILGVGLPEETLIRTVARVDNYKLKDEAVRIGVAFTESDTLRITSREGTDYTEDISDKIGTMGILWADEPKAVPYEFVPLATPGIDRQPPKSGNGVLVYDGYCPPTGEIHEPVRVTVENDTITKVDGGYAAERFWQYIKDWPEKYLCEIQIGTNPNALIRNRLGRITAEWERVRGSVHIGMGDYMPYPAYDENGKLRNPGWKPAKYHCDGLILSPTITLDEKVVVKDGVIQKPFAAF